MMKRPIRTTSWLGKERQIGKSTFPANWRPPCAIGLPGSSTDNGVAVRVDSH
jgi:hypothetical protein